MRCLLCFWLLWSNWLWVLSRYGDVSIHLKHIIDSNWRKRLLDVLKLCTPCCTILREVLSHVLITISHIKEKNCVNLESGCNESDRLLSCRHKSHAWLSRNNKIARFLSLVSLCRDMMQKIFHRLPYWSDMFLRIRYD